MARYEAEDYVENGGVQTEGDTTFVRTTLTDPDGPGTHMVSIPDAYVVGEPYDIRARVRGATIESNVARDLGDDSSAEIGFGSGEWVVFEFSTQGVDPWAEPGTTTSNWHAYIQSGVGSVDIDWIEIRRHDDTDETPNTAEGTCVSKEGSLLAGVGEEHVVEWVAAMFGTVNANVVGSFATAALQVLHGPDYGTAVEVASGAPTATPFDAINGDTYWFRIHDPAENGGAWTLNFGSPAVYAYSDWESVNAANVFVRVVSEIVRETQEATGVADAEITLLGWTATEAKTLTAEAIMTASGTNGDIWHIAVVVNGVLEVEDTYTHDGNSATFKTVPLGDVTVANNDVVAVKVWSEGGEVATADVAALIDQVSYLSHDDTDCFPGTICDTGPDGEEPVAADPCARNDVPTDPCAPVPDADISDPEPACPDPGGDGSTPDPDPDAEPPTDEDGAGSSRITVLVTDPVADQELDGSTYRLKATATITGDDSISTVQFLLGDRFLIGEATTQDPYTYDWEISDMTPGTYQLWARATSTTGAVATSPWVQIVILDTQPPVVTITTPVAASTVNGLVPLAALVEDNGTIATVQFSLDNGAMEPMIGGGPWSALMDVSELDEGTYTVEVLATDESGNVGTDSIGFTVGDGALDPIVSTRLGSPFPPLRVLIDELSEPAEAWEAQGAATDVTDVVAGFSRTRGASNERDQPSTGTVNMTLRSPLSLEGLNLPARKIRIEYMLDSPYWATWFEGFIEQPTDTYPSHRSSRLELTAVDYQFGLAQASVVVERPVELSGARIEAILDEIGWTGGTDIDTGHLQVQAIVAPTDGTPQTPISALAHIQEVADAELGRFYVTADGTATYEDRDHRSSATRSVVSQGVFGHAGYTEGEFPYLRSSLSKQYDLGSVFNRFHLQRNNGQIQTFADTDSEDRYWPRAFGENPAAILYSTRAVTQLGTQLLARYKDPHPLIGQITIRPTSTNTEALWLAVLDMEISDRLTVHVRPNGVDLERYSCLVEGMSDTVDANARTWLQTLTLSQPFPQPTVPEPGDPSLEAGAAMGEDALGAFALAE